MGPVLRMIKGGAAAFAREPEDDPLPLPERPETLFAARHLAGCPHCGAMNGRAVEICWSCESALDATSLLRQIVDFDLSAGVSPEAKPPGATDARMDAAVEARAQESAAEHTHSLTEPVSGVGLDMNALLGTAGWDANEVPRTMSVLTTTPGPQEPLSDHGAAPLALNPATAFARPPRLSWRVYAVAAVAIVFVCGVVNRSMHAAPSVTSFAGAGLLVEPSVRPHEEPSTVDASVRPADVLFPLEDTSAVASIKPPVMANRPKAKKGHSARTRLASQPGIIQMPPAELPVAPRAADARPAIVTSCTTAVAALGLCN
jgi:hypothetical protein